MSLYTPSSPHFHTNNSVTQIMLKVLIALIPGIVVYVIFFGYGVVFNIAAAVITALGFEALMLIVRKRPLMPFLSDGSAVVTAVLLALSVPSIAPWWIIFLGTGFAIVIAKHLYGGLGYNPFNPAMIGYAMLLISFPKEMTQWAAPLTVSNTFIGLQDSLTIFIAGAHGYDAISSATALDYLKTQLNLQQTTTQIMQHNSFGLLGGSAVEWINLAFLAGGLWLIKHRIITWHIPLAFLGSLFLMALLFNLIDSDRFASPFFHLFSGAAMLGAFFIATDPVSAATSPKGRIIYGIGIGILIYIIRTWGGFPDAVAFAVLLMNITAPTIDYYTRPKPYGHP